MSSNPVHGDVYPMQHYVIKFVSEFAIGRWFSPGTPASSTNKTDRHDRTEIVFKKEFKDTIGVIRIRISKNRQHNDQKKKDKRTNNDLQNIHIKLKIEEQLCATLSANVNINYRLPKYTTVFVLLDISKSK